MKRRKPPLKPENVKKWKSFKQWEIHKDFFNANKNNTPLLLLYMFKVLSDKRGFRYMWIEQAHGIALSKVLDIEHSTSAWEKIIIGNKLKQKE